MPPMKAHYASAWQNNNLILNQKNMGDFN